MNLTKTMGFLSGAAALTLGGVALAGSEADNSDLKAQIRDLQNRLAEIEGTQSSQWLTEQRAAEIRGLVYDVLADADTRASLLQGGANAGFGPGGFYISDGTGNNRLNIGAMTQVRFMYGYNKTGTGSRSRSGFDNPNTRIDLSGNVVSPNWNYRIQGNFDVDGGDFNLLDAYIRHDYDNGWSVTVGQFKSPLTRETLVDVRHQQLASRSLIDNAFSAGRTQGIMAGYADDNIRAWLSYNDGAGTADTPAFDRTTDWAFTGRVEFKAQGTWGQFDDFSSWDGEEMGVLIGGGINYERADMAGGAKTFTGTVDAQLEFGGANVFGAFYFQDVSSGGPERWGLVLQGGLFLVPDEWELFGRFEWGNDDTAAENLTLLTAGVNRYFSRNNAKWTTDIGWNFNRDVSSFWSDRDLTGWRTNATSDRQVVVRSQIQLYF